MASFKVLLVLLLDLVILVPQEANAEIPRMIKRRIYMANRNGPFVGVVVPNTFELNPLLQSPSYISQNITIDFAGRRFRFGTVSEKNVILVMTGLGMINAGITTQLLLSLFRIEGVIHYGTAGNANPELHPGDVTIPQYWSHTALWSWQRYGDGPQNELPLEVNGDYTRDIGYLKFANFTTNITKGDTYDNMLNNVWYQPEEVFPIDGTPEERQHAFWVPVDTCYYEISKKLEGLELESCLNSTTCLPYTPKVVRVLRGTSASIFLSNTAYKSFLYNKFNISTLDMESASVALISLQQRIPFIAIRAISGAGISGPYEASTMISVLATNAVKVVMEFIKNLDAEAGLSFAMK